MRIAIIGDYSADSPTHPATEAAIGHAAAAAGMQAETAWIPSLTAEGDTFRPDDWDGLWIAPGVPESESGVLRAIREAREAKMPVLGTCGGFQSIVLEFARNALGIADAVHAEREPEGANPVVTRLGCSLAGREGEVIVRRGSLAYAAYRQSRVTEPFRCSFGLNANFAERLEAAGLRITGSDAGGEPRIVEAADRSFYVGTLFVPQLRSRPGRPHPLVAAFAASCLQARK